MSSRYSIWAFLGLNAAGYNIGMKKAAGAARQLGGELKDSMKNAIGAGALTALSNKVVNFADNIVDLSERLAMSTDELQVWNYGVRNSGTSMPALVSFFEKLKSSRDEAVDGNEKLVESFANLGITIDMLKVNRVGDLAKSISRAARSGNMDKIFSDLKNVGGKTVGELSVLLKTPFEEMASAARESGQIISAETLVEVKALKTELQNLADVFSGPFTEILGNLYTYVLSPFIRFFEKAGAFFGALSVHGPTVPSKVTEQSISESFSAIDKKWVGKESNRASLAQSIRNQNNLKEVLGPELPTSDQQVRWRGMTARTESGRSYSFKSLATADEMLKIARQIQAKLESLDRKTPEGED